MTPPTVVTDAMLADGRAKICNVCHVAKVKFHFTNDRSRKFGYHNTCKECLYPRNNESAAQYRQRRMLWNGFKLTVEQYEAMLEEQGGVCAICERPETNTYLGVVRRLAVDHDHTCCPGDKSCGECVRGLLCSACNTALGRLNDDLDRLQAAMDYLVSFSRS